MLRNHDSFRVPPGHSQSQHAPLGVPLTGEPSCSFVAGSLTVSFQDVQLDASVYIPDEEQGVGFFSVSPSSNISVYGSQLDDDDYYDNNLAVNGAQEATVQASGQTLLSPL